MFSPNFPLITMLTCYDRTKQPTWNEDFTLNIKEPSTKYVQVTLTCVSLLGNKFCAQPFLQIWPAEQTLHKN